MKTMIAIDLDGTLLNKEGLLSPKTLTYIRNLDKNKYIVILSSGRPYRGILPFYNELSLDTPIIYDNGSSIKNPKDDSFVGINEVIPLEEFKDTFLKVKDLVLNGLYCKEQLCYVFNRNDKLDFLMHIEDESQVVDGPFDETAKESPSSIIFVVKPGSEEEFEEIIKATSSMETRFWGKYYGVNIYEVYLKNFSKASSLKYLLNYYSLTSENLICFGDGINDDEMLKYAKIGVAMKNAKDGLKLIADYITDYTNDEDGVVQFLKKIL